MRQLFAACVLALSTAAQTFVVDAANGPGASYTSIAAAAAAVPSGSTLVVRAGFYTAFAVANKSLTILGDPSVLVTSAPWTPTTIGPLAATEQVVLRNLWFFGNHFSTQAHVTISNSLGTVMLERCGARQFNWLVVTANACDRLVARGLVPEPGGTIKLWLAGTNAVVDACTLAAPSGSAIDQTGGTLQVVDSMLQAGFAATTPPPGLAMNGGDARLLGTTAVHGGSATAYAIGGTGSVRVDPSVVLVGATPPIAPVIAATTVSMPRMTTSLTLSNQVTAILQGPNGHIGIICIALPGPRVAVPWLTDAVWLDGATLHAAVTGVVTAQAVTSQHTIPPGVLGLPVMWQAVTWDPAAGWQVSNPTVRVVP